MEAAAAAAAAAVVVVVGMPMTMRMKMKIRMMMRMRPYEAPRPKVSAQGCFCVYGVLLLCVRPSVKFSCMSDESTAIDACIEETRDATERARWPSCVGPDH